MSDMKTVAKRSSLALAVLLFLIGIIGGLVLQVISETLVTYFLGGSIVFGFLTVALSALLSSKYVTWEALFGGGLAIEGQMFLMYRDIIAKLFDILSRLK